MAAAERNFGKNDVCDIPINVAKYEQGKHESFLRMNNVSKEDLHHHMKVNEQKGHVKGRGISDTTTLNEAPVIIMQDMKVSLNTLTRRTETLLTVVHVPKSDFSRNVD